MQRCGTLACLTPGLLLLCAPARADEATAAARVVALGGMVTRDETIPGKPVTKVMLQATEATDADLAVLQELKQLKVLYLGYGTKTTDAGLAQLRRITSLEELYLPETAITDAGLASLQGLTRLRKLGLVFCKGITDKGLVYLKGLKNLQDLNLSSTQVTVAGVADLHKALPGAYISGGLHVLPKGYPTRAQRLQRLKSAEPKGVGAEMLDFMSYFDSTEAGSDAAVKQYVVEGPGVFDLRGMTVEKPHVMKIERQGGRVWYLMQLRGGKSRHVYRVCWSGGKIRKVKQVSVTFD